MPTLEIQSLSGKTFELEMPEGMTPQQAVAQFREHRRSQFVAPTSDINDPLMKSTVQVESGGNPNAVSPKGAQGTMQVMPKTQMDPGYGVKPSNGTPEDTARAGRDYKVALYNKFQDADLAELAYNWGPGNVDKWLASGGRVDQLPKEAREYPGKVLGGVAPQAAPPQAPVAPVVPPVAPRQEPKVKPAVNETAAETNRLANAGRKPNVLVRAAEAIGQPFADFGQAAANSIQKMGATALENTDTGRLLKATGQENLVANALRERANENPTADTVAGKLGAGAPSAVEELVVGGKGVGPGVGLLKRTAVNAAQGGGAGFARTPQEGETRLGNAVSGAVGNVLGSEAGNVVGKGINWAARTPAARAAVKTYKALRGAAGGEDALQAGMGKLGPSASGVPLTPAQKMEIPGLSELEQRARSTDIPGWSSVDDAADTFAAQRGKDITDTATSFRQQAADEGRASLNKVRMNDTHRTELFNGINAIKQSKEFKMDKAAQAQLDDIMSRYEKGGGFKYVGHLRDELDNFINSSTKLSPEKKASYMKDFDKYFGPMSPGNAAAAAKQAEVDALEQSSQDLLGADVARSQSTRTPLGPKRDIVGGALSGAKSVVNFAKGRPIRGSTEAARAVNALRGKVPSKELNEALKSDDALRTVIRKYDRVRTDAEVDKMVAALMGRGVGAAATQE